MCNAQYIDNQFRDLRPLRLSRLRVVSGDWEPEILPPNLFILQVSKENMKMLNWKEIYKTTNTLTRWRSLENHSFVAYRLFCWKLITLLLSLHLAIAARQKSRRNLIKALSGSWEVVGRKHPVHKIAHKQPPKSRMDRRAERVNNGDHGACP